MITEEGTEAFAKMRAGESSRGDPPLVEFLCVEKAKTRLRAVCKVDKRRNLPSAGDRSTDYGKQNYVNVC